MKIAVHEGDLEAAGVQAAPSSREKQQASLRPSTPDHDERPTRTSPDPTWCTDRYRLVTPYSLRVGDF